MATKKKKHTKGYKKQKRVLGLTYSNWIKLFSLALFLLTLVFFGESLSLPQLFDKIVSSVPQVAQTTSSTSSRSSGGVRQVEQSGSGLYFPDGSPFPTYVVGQSSQTLDLNNGKPFFTVEELNTINTSPNGYYTYGGQDMYGRMSQVTAVITKSNLVPSEERRGIDLPEPVGWVGRSSGGIYDRSHGIAFTLGGKNDLDNLFTGTISLNQKHMVEVEDTVRDYIKETGKPVLYRVTPYYLGSELVPRGVLMEAYSSEGTIQFCRFIYNVQDGYDIRYENGEVLALE